jgi:hypothetical protein
VVSLPLCQFGTPQYGRFQIVEGRADLYKEAVLLLLQGGSWGMEVAVLGVTQSTPTQTLGGSSGDPLFSTSPKQGDCL